MAGDTWSEARIGDLGEVFTGRTPPTERASYFGDEFPFITPGDMHQGKYVRETQRGVSNEGAELLARIKVPANSVCVSCIGWQMGEVVMTSKPSFTNQQINSIVPNGKADASFLYYSLLPRKKELLSLGAATGVRTPILNKSAFCDLKVRLPSLPVQRRIAGILSAYDDLIANNLRRIRILEGMARALYREWFIHFRFPGHEKLPRVASPLDDIPRGWEVVSFTEIAEVLSGGTPKTNYAEYWNGDIPFFTPRDAPDCFYVRDTDKHITDLGLSNCASELYPPDTVFITARGTVGKVALPSVPMAMNQSCYALRGKPGIPQRFLFLMTLQQVDYLKTNTGGATFDTIVVDTFRRMKVVKPACEIIARFASHSDAIFEQINTLQRKVQNLRRTRDFLLPRLVGGECKENRDGR